MTSFVDFNPSVTVPFPRMRALLGETAGLQEGVVAAGDLMATQRGAGANLSTDVAIGAAWVQMDTGTRNGLPHVYFDAVSNVVITTANGTNPRIDQILLRYNDSSIPTGSGNVPTLEVATGTATSGATLANRTGAAALPNDCLRLADVLVPALDTTITNDQIRDRRPWARGASLILNQPSTTDLTFSATTYTTLFTWTVPRVEFSGAPVFVTASFIITNSTTAGNLGVSVATDGTADATLARYMSILATVDNRIIAVTWGLAPAAGSHTIDIMGRMAGSGNCVVVRNSATGGLPQMTIQELVRQNTANNTTTTG